jgi:hypothetical protein
VSTPFLDTIFGIPIGKEHRERAYRNVVGELRPADAFARILGGMQHNTDKAGALLAAQDIFAVACTFAIDHGWPRLPALARHSASSGRSAACHVNSA